MSGELNEQAAGRALDAGHRTSAKTPVTSNLFIHRLSVARQSWLAR